MTTKELVNLMIQSSDSLPHLGKLPMEQNIRSAIALTRLFKEFAEEGYTDEAMDVSISQWNTVEGRLKIILSNINKKDISKKDD